MPRFSDMVDAAAGDIKQPPLLPAGTYMLMVKSYPEQDEHQSQKGGNFDRLTYNLAVVEPYGDTVDPDDLEAFGKVQGVTVKNSFYFNTSEDEQRSFDITMNEHKNFLIALGVWNEDDDKTLKEAMAETPGQTCLADIGHRPDPNNPERFYLEITRVYREE